MNSYDLCDAILKDSSLTSAEKLVGMAIALRINRKTLKTRLSMHSLAEQCAVSPRSAIRAVSRLVDAGYFTRQRTGRSPILSASSGTNTGNVDVPPMTHQKCHQRHIGTEKKDGLPWVYDLTHSTLPEEKQKRIDAQAV